MVRVINRMTKEEAEKAGVENPRLYFKVYIDKNNLGPPAESADWFKLISVDLGNNPTGVGGDNIGVVDKWLWPDHLAGVAGKDFDAVAAVIRAGKWRLDVQAKGWIGKAVAKALWRGDTLLSDRLKSVQYTRPERGVHAGVFHNCDRDDFGGRYKLFGCLSAGKAFAREANSTVRCWGRGRLGRYFAQVR
jgi:hypothetical protein